MIALRSSLKVAGILFAVSLPEAGAQAAALENGDILSVWGGAVARTAAADSSQSLLTPTTARDYFGIDVDLQGTIYVTQWNNGGGPGALYRVDPLTGIVSQIGAAGFLREPTDVDILSSGKLLVADPDALDGDGALIEVDPASGEQSIRYRGRGASRKVGTATLDDFGRIYFLSETLDSGVVVFRLDPEDTVAVPVSFGGILIGQSFITMGSNVIYASSYMNGTGMIVRIDPQTGAQSIVSQGGELEGPVGIDVRSDGCLVVIDDPVGCNPCCCRRKLLCVDPNTGEQGLISQYGYLRLGGVAVFGDASIPARRTTWGSLKEIYRH